MRNPGRYLYLCALILLFSFPLTLPAQDQRVDIALDAQKIGADESVILTVRAVGMDEELDSSNLTNDFDVNRRSSSRQVNIINGKRTSIIEWILELTPKRSGVLTVGPIQVGPQASRSVILMVDEPATGSNRDLFVETSVDVLDPYVQSQVIYTVNVYQGVRLLDGSLSVPETDLAIVRQIGSDQSFKETVDGREYSVVQRRYSLFPRKSGPLELPQVVLQATVAIDNKIVPNARTRTRRFTRRSNVITLDVKPRPQTSDGSWWLPATQVLLGSEWSDPIDPLQVDEPITRTIRLQARGVADSQLPEIPVPTVDNVSIYADSPTASTDTSGSDVIAEQVVTWAVIPQQVGKLVLPEVRVEWFDTAARESKVAILPEEVLNVIGPATANQSSAPASNLTAVETNATQASTAEGNQAALAVERNPLDENVPNQNLNSANTSSLSTNSVLVNSANWWRNVAMFLLLGWVLSLAGLWYRLAGRSNSASVNSSGLDNETVHQRFRRTAAAPASLDRIKEACSSEDPSKIAQAVLGWGVMVWPERPPTHIRDVAQRLNSSELQAVFAELDALQYSNVERNNSSVNGVTLEAIPKLIQGAVMQLDETSAEIPHAKALPEL